VDTAGLRSDDDRLATLANAGQELSKINRLIADAPAIAVWLRSGVDEDVPSLTKLLRHNATKHQDVPIVRLHQFGDPLAKLLAEPDVLTVDYHDPRAGRRLAVGLLLDHRRGRCSAPGPRCRPTRVARQYAAAVPVR